MVNVKKIFVSMLSVFLLAGCSIAKKEPVTHTITFSADGGTFASGEDKFYVTATEGEPFEIPANPIWDGHSFDGWKAEGETDILDSHLAVADAEVHATWTELEYTVNFYSDEAVVDTRVVKWGENVAEPKTPPAKTDSKFTGWYVSSDSETPYDFAEPITSDLNLYAQFVSTITDLTTLDSYVFQSQVRDPYVWMGCETASLMIALKTTGHIQDKSFTAMLNELPKTDSDNPYLGFCGDLYSDTWTRDAVMPNIVTEWGAQYGNTKDLTKQGLEPVIEALQNGHPVVVWTSSKMVPSETVWDDTKTGLTDDATDPITGEVLNYFGSTGSHWEYKTHNHVMTLVGYNSTTGEFKLADPAEWKGPEYWVSYDTFMNSWNCYQGAVEVW